MQQQRASRLWELAAVFLKLGTIGFGGPAAHIALMEDEFVRRRHWLTRDEFLDLIGAANLIPGPNSTEVAIHVGRLRAGVPGLIVAGSAFIFPAFCIVTAIAWAYAWAGKMPVTLALLRGIKPVMIAIVLQALVGLGKTAIKSWLWAIVGLAAMTVAVLRPEDEVAILAAVGIGAGLVAWIGTRKPRAVALSVTPVALWPLFLVFAKAGALLFGSGYVLLAFLRGDLVQRLGWLTNAQLLDAIAVGQVTPGPVFTTATFIGYNLAGMPGAIVATIGIFLPAFLFVAISGPLIPAMRRSRVAGMVLDAVSYTHLTLPTIYSV